MTDAIHAANLERKRVKRELDRKRMEDIRIFTKHRETVKTLIEIGVTQGEAVDAFMRRGLTLHNATFVLDALGIQFPAKKIVYSPTLNAEVERKRYLQELSMT